MIYTETERDNVESWASHYLVNCNELRFVSAV